MRYAVVGAGAVGGGVAALMHEAGLDVTLVARGATLEAVRGSGLRLAVGHEERAVTVPVVSRLQDVVWAEDSVLLVAVKSQQTTALLPDLADVPPHVPVGCLQNGVANERVLLEHREHVHGIVVMMPTSSLRPGRVVVHSLGRPGLLDIGLASGGTDTVDDAVSADLRLAGFDSLPRDDVMAWKRRKLVLNLANAVDAAYVDAPPATELVEVLREEGERALRAAGLSVVSAEDDQSRRGRLLRPLVRRDEAGGSTWQSLARGSADTEVDQLNGEIVRLGAEHGVATPANTAVRDEVAALVAAGGRPRSLDAAALLARLRGG